MNRVLYIAETNYDIKDGYLVWAKWSNAPINLQYRFKVEIYIYEELGLLFSHSYSIVTVVARGISS